MAPTTKRETWRPITRQNQEPTGLCHWHGVWFRLPAAGEQKEWWSQQPMPSTSSSAWTLLMNSVKTQQLCRDLAGNYHLDTWKLR